MAGNIAAEPERPGITTLPAPYTAARTGEHSNELRPLDLRAAIQTDGLLADLPPLDPRTTTRTDGILNELQPLDPRPATHTDGILTEPQPLDPHTAA